MWLTALILGFAGSVHCLGMCTPLAMAVTSMRPAAVLNRIVYNAGRITIYSLAGALVASAGMIIPLYRYQNVFSIALGLTLLIVGLGGIKRLRIERWSRVVQHITLKIKSMFAAQLTRKTRGAMFVLGALNGLLPCGLTLTALTWCITLRGPLDGFNFMLLFGAGTLPVMLGLTGILPALANKFNWNIQKLTTTVLIVSGCILIARVFFVHIPQGNEETLVEIICR